MRRVALIIVFLGATLSTAWFLNSIPQNSIQDSSASINQETRVDLPARLKIPSIKVDAFIGEVSLTSDGAMDVPDGPNDVAWFNLGARPGEEGSAVIAGHYGWKNDIPAVFDDLHKLRKGDRLFVESETGEIIAFVVRETKIYGKDEATPVFGSNDGESHLNLVTCTGDWNAGDKTYSERLVVFTDKINE